ncbi:MAG: single-stranded-DNA-specific exonuclease RecJ [Candidatus Moranbacteria bacterium]|nr:single-stranded-DNA-specific exonuclease RecJ [Candidatus Moranbacteria bacterium]
MPNHEELLEILLNNRGIEIKDREKFLNPSYEDHLNDPFLLKGMETSVVRFFEAVSNNQKIVIYSDYDADGIPAAVILHDFLKKINYENFSVYIPHRHDEGYGLHADAIEEFVKDKVNLLITLDLGITAKDEIAQAKIGEIDTIVIDHHLPQESLPSAYAIIDPKVELDEKLNRNQDKIPTDPESEDSSSMLCGAGLTFKFVQALISKYGEYWNIKDGWEKWLLDMAGVATIADQVPLLGENRVLAFFGLKVLKKTKRDGLKELFVKSGVSISNITEEDVSFTLAPRINVASRMANPMLAFELLSTEDKVKAKTLADLLDKINGDRKHIVAQIMKEVKATLNKRFENEDYINQPFIVIGNPKWHVGVLGLIASKITEEYKKTVFVWGGEEDIIRGSCRSYGEINLVEIMSQLPDGALTEFGGHKGAGGFSAGREEIVLLEEKLKNIFSDTQNKEELEEQMIDAKISIDDVTEDNYKVIEKMAPFGMGNPKPIFMLENLEIFEVKEFGKEKNHLELSFKNTRGKIIKAISFFKTRNDYEGVNLASGNKICLIANFEKNNFMGREELRMRIVDIKY